MGGLIAVAALPWSGGLSASAYRHPAELAAGFHAAMWITAGMCGLGGLFALFTIGKPAATTAPALAPAAVHHCALDATPLRGARSCPDRATTSHIHTKGP